MKVIEIEGLVKKYGDFLAVDNISLDIEEGEIYGLLGPNGAGKSTTISTICGLTKPTDGDVKIFGKSIKDNDVSLKRKIGLVPQSIALYKDFTAKENLNFFGEIYGLRGKELKSAVDKALEFVGLTEVKNKRAKEYSGGMLRRLNIACAIVHSPKIIIMDEPTVGIDAQSRNHILESIKRLNREGATIIYTSHYMEEIETICSKIAIIDHGKVIVEGDKDELKNIVDDKKTLTLTLNSYDEVNISELKNVKGVLSVYQDENLITINTSKDGNNLDKIINYFTQNEISINNIGYREVTLETVFLTLTGRSLRE
ncbi:ABC transporter ATP-binding protein [Clostridium sp. LP20]|uniref:ABC transporter ATP-binding protein n=1 Tax=Clostridium sp. LP20 TaxID=3418665 RepID=UPI003EE441E7